ncbi:hypothetical protein FACS1894190_11820 [Spirochaetia bacterium]|nr:hypothetical protein FACS1894190_11820 [Spirochaetia bacterium]
MKKVFAVAAAAVLVFGLASCKGKKTETSVSITDTLAPPASPYRYSLASGSVGGNFYLMGGGLAQTLNNHLPHYFLWTSETTGGGTANARMLEEGDAELGIVMTSSLLEATKGEAEWTGKKVHGKLRGAVPVYPSWLTIYTLSNSGIKSLTPNSAMIYPAY